MMKNKECLNLRHLFRCAICIILLTASEIQAQGNQKQAFVPENWPDPPPYVSWITTGQGLAFCTGMLGFDPATFRLADSFEEEVSQLMENLSSMLTAAGSSLENLVQVTVYLTDLELYSTFNRVYLKYLKNTVKPARTAVVVAELPMGARAEVDCIAVVPDN